MVPELVPHFVSAIAERALQGPHLEVHSLIVALEASGGLFARERLRADRAGIHN